MTPKLSILLPTYNGEPFLDEQLESVLAQTDADFELLAIDDGSSDGTPALLDRFAAREARISVIPSEGNRGQNTRLAELLGHARGTYVAVCDQDDRWAPARNARLFAALGGRAMAFGRSELIDARGDRIGKSLLEFCNAEFHPDDKLRALLQPMFSAHATIVRRAAISVEAFSHPLPFDWLMALEALFTEGLAYCDEAVVFHRIHGGNQVNNIGVERAGTRPSASDLRHILLFQTPDRIRLWLVFDYLGRSRRLDPGLRRTFHALAGQCHTIWFSEWRALKPNHAGLRDRIMGALTPLAGAESDRRQFEQQVDALTRPLLSRATLRAAWGRYQWRKAN